MKHEKQKYIHVLSHGDHIKHIHVDSKRPPEKKKNISIVHSVDILMKWVQNYKTTELRN